MIKRTLIFSIFLLHLSCSGIRVKKDYAENYNFKKLKTYALVDEKSEKISSNSLIGQRVTKSLHTNLKNIGLELGQKDKADFFVELNYKTERIVTPPSSTVGLGVGSAGGFGFGGVSLGVGSGSTRIENRVIVKMYDSQSKKEIWSGEVEGNFEYDDPKETSSRLEEVIKKIISEFAQKI